MIKITLQTENIYFVFIFLLEEIDSINGLEVHPIVEHPIYRLAHINKLLFNISKLCDQLIKRKRTHNI